MRSINYLNRILILLILVLFSFYLFGCNKEAPAPDQSSAGLSAEEQKRIDLYVAVMTAAFNEENGGNKFIAVKLDSLTGLSQESRMEVLKRLKKLAPQVYDFEAVKTDNDKFRRNGEMLGGTIDGTVLSIKLDSYSDNRAVIRGTSWFGNLGAVRPEYEAAFSNGQWQLKLLSMAVS